MRISYPVGYLIHLSFLGFPLLPKVFHKGEAKALNFVLYQTGFSVLTHLTSTVWISALSSFWAGTSYLCLLI